MTTITCPSWCDHHDTVYDQELGRVDTFHRRILREGDQECGDPFLLPRVMVECGGDLDPARHGVRRRRRLPRRPAPHALADAAEEYAGALRQAADLLDQG